MARRHPLGSGSVDPSPYGGGEDANGGYAARGGNVNVASGRANLTNNFLSDRPLTYTNVCSWTTQGGPMPVSLLVGVDSRQGVTIENPYVTELQVLSQVAGANLFPYVIEEGQPVPAPPLGGVLRVTYGIGTSVKVLEADIRAGSYQLPPCDRAQLDAFLWLFGAADFDLIGGIVPGVLPTPSRFTASARLRIPAGESKTIYVPLGARWMAMAGGNPTGTGLGQPILVAKQGESSVFLLHDYQTGSFLSQPGQPVELFNRENVVISNGGPDLAYVIVRFFLEV
jgi:hypothetical protein